MQQSSWACSGQQPIVSCSQGCDFWAPPRGYSLRASKRERKVDEVFSLRVQQNSEFRVSPGNRSLEALGAIAGIAGPVAGVIGTFLVVDAIAALGCDICSINAQEANVGYALIGIGAVTTPLGWVAFAMNRPRLDRIVDDSAASEPQLRLGVQPLPRG
ncbi:MAG TPA: hypothetical protein VGL19_24290, partial [Polyangiaceae bacterium]